MKPDKISEFTSVSDLICLIDDIFADLNMGLFIYHIEDPNKTDSLRLIYANNEASRYTGVDLQQRVGKYIYDAFPSLKGTEIPKAFHDVILSRKATRIGVVDYSDEYIGPSSYSVKAFPMPNQCLGVIFENVALRKRVDELLKKHTSDLEEQKSGLQNKISRFSQELNKDLQQIMADINELKSSGKSPLTKKQMAALDDLARTAEHLSELINTLPAPQSD